MTAREITLDAAAWREFRDIYAAMLPALGAPDWHGPNLDAVYDALVAGHYRVMSDSAAVPDDDASKVSGDNAGIEQARPLRVTMINTSAASAAVRAYLARLVTVFDDARAQCGVEATLRLA
jgi:RNAse (barnase) inhibitor barstar